MASNQNSIDPVKELRLRRWAREHYVSQSERQPNWHPIVLEEMARRDREQPLRMLSEGGSNGGGGFVPLSPEPVHMLHGPEKEIKAPHFLSAVPAEEFFYIPG